MEKMKIDGISGIAGSPGHHNKEIKKMQRHGLVGTEMEPVVHKGTQQPRLISCFLSPLNRRHQPSLKLFLTSFFSHLQRKTSGSPNCATWVVCERY
jgi:hypothetical protein